MAEWGVHVSHTTIMRWVHRYVPEYEKRWNRRAKPVGSFWRMETYIFRLDPRRAQARKDRRVARNRCGNGLLPQNGRDLHPPIPAKDHSNKQSHWGLRRLRREDWRWKYVLVRNSQYLNNIGEQDHRAINGRCRPMLGFKCYRTAAVTLAGIELAHRIRKRQFKFGPGRWICWSWKTVGLKPWHELGDLLIHVEHAGIP
jgi:hypothetical protein